MKDFTNPAFIRFYTESLEKENDLRTRWFLKNLEKAKELARSKKEKFITANDVMECKFKGGMNMLSVQLKDGAKFNRCKISRDGQIPEASKEPLEKEIQNLLPELKQFDDVHKVPIMKPVDPTLINVFVQPKPHYGREVYLKKRGKILPEDRYFFNRCVNWDYGWRLKDSNQISLEKKVQGRYGRRAVLTTAINYVGPQPDHSHYQEPFHTYDFCKSF